MSTPSAQVRGPLPRLVTGFAWAIGSMAIFALVPVCVRQLADSMPASELVFFRSFFGFLILVPWFGWRGRAALRTPRFGLHLTRSVLLFTGMVLWFYALGEMALDKAVAIHFTMPLFIVIFAALLLGERVRADRWIAAMVGFAGVLVILRPGMVEVGLPAIGLVASAALYGLSMVQVKIILRTDTPVLQNFYSNLLMALMALPVALFDWHMPAADDIPWLILLGSAGAAAPYCVAVAMRILDASVVAPFDFLRLPFTAFLAYLFFGETPEVWTWAGAAIIIAATWHMMRRERAGGEPERQS